MTISIQESPPLSPHIGVNDAPPQKKRLSLLAGFPSTSTPFTNDDEASESSPNSVEDDEVSMADYCQPCGVEHVVVPVQHRRRKRRGGKGVSFALSANQEIETLHRKEYSALEFTATWYSAQELYDMKKARRSLIQRMDLANNQWGHLENNNTDLLMCTRGLEGKTKAGRRQRYAEMAAVTAAVLDEQDAQYARGILEANVIAHLCEMHTRQSMMRARSQGLKDARVASMT